MPLDLFSFCLVSSIVCCALMIRYSSLARRDSSSFSLTFLLLFLIASSFLVRPGSSAKKELGAGAARSVGGAFTGLKI